MDTALRHDFKDGIYRRVRHPAGWLSLHMGDIQVRSIIATARVHIEAVPLPFSIRDGYRAPAGHEDSIAKKRRIRQMLNPARSQTSGRRLIHRNSPRSIYDERARERERGERRSTELFKQDCPR